MGKKNKKKSSIEKRSSVKASVRAPNLLLVWSYYRLFLLASSVLEQLSMLLVVEV